MPELATGIERMAGVLGVRPVPGGRHPAWGTHNALVSLGPGCYLELIAPDLEATSTAADDLPFGLGGLEAPRLVTWALRHERIESAADALSLGPVTAGRRRQPDGTLLRWRLSDPRVERLDGILPFLIAWGDSPHPATSAPAAGELVGLRLRHPSPDTIRASLARLGVGSGSDETRISVERADEAGLCATILTARGPVKLT